MFYIVKDNVIVGKSEKEPLISTSTSTSTSTSILIVESTLIYEVGFVRVSDSDVFVSSKTLEEQTVLANAECTTRIEVEWSQIGQNNAIFGVYGEEAKLECGQWIAAHREALMTLLAREDLTEIDVTKDEYWPTSIEEIKAKLATKKTGLLGRFKKTASA